MTRSVVIVGAGLGGMTAALCLQRRGLHVTVLEQASALGEVGAGVQVSANGSRVLHELGLTDALTRTAFVPERGEMRHWKTGETLVSRPLGATSVERYGFPYYHLHRADFHAALVQKFHEGGLGEIHLGKKVLSIEQDQSEVIARTESGETYRAQVLVGCDGIHSSVRAALFGAAEPRFTGCVAWRATIAVEKLPAGHVRPVASNWIGQGGHFVHYYLRRGELVNCVGVIERDEWLAESWSARGEPADFAADFAGWHSDLHTLIDNAEECFRWGLFDRDPLPQWSTGRVTLLGDACHAMLPFMAQGAVMAIEDAYTLTECLVANAEVEQALAHYQTLRRERTATVQQMSRANIEFFHNPQIENLEARLNEHREAHAWLYGHDVTGVDFRASQ